MSALGDALDLRRRGLSVIPVPRPDATHDGKRPAIPWKEYQTRLATEDEIRAWFHVEQNIAIVTGAVSGIVVVDLDSEDARRWVWRRLPFTPWQTRTSRGFHLFYRHPGVRVPNRAKLDTGGGRIALDVRGDGGFVIGPGSIHASGRVYDRVGDWTAPRTRLPRFWIGLLEQPKRASASPSRTCTRPSGHMIERARKYLAGIPVPVIGAGSDQSTLYAAARMVRGFALSESDAVELLWQWAGGRSGWTREWLVRKVRNAEQYGSEPIGGLR
jgi:Bifunctional DNA primase/polymerase, N-terminal